MDRADDGEHALTGRGTPRQRGFRRVERWMIGVIFAVLAFMLEKVVMRSVRRQGRETGPSPDIVTTQLTGSGADVDFE